MQKIKKIFKTKVNIILLFNGSEWIDIKNCIVKYFYTLFICIITKNVYYNVIVKVPLCVTRYMGILRMNTFEINEI